MIPSLLNTVVGLALAYAAIFPDSIGAGRERLVLGAAIATILLALWARRSDAAHWQSSTSIAAGALLALIMVMHQAVPMSPVLLFWCVLWAGLVPAVVSLWAALYRPVPSATPAE